MPIFLAPADLSTQNLDQDGHAVSRGSNFVPPPLLTVDNTVVTVDSTTVTADTVVA